VISAAFNDAARVRLRVGIDGEEIEGSLILFAPRLAISAPKLAQALKLPDQKPKIFVPTLEEMASFIDCLEAEHARTYALLALCTWARPEAVADIRASAWDRRTGLLDLNPAGRVQTNKRRSQIVVCRALAQAFGALPDPPMQWRGEAVANVKKAFVGAARRSGVPVTRKTFRTFMATTVRKLCPAVPREMRSVWLGHSVLEGSRTTDHYEVLDPDYLLPAALATDYVFCQLQRLCARPLLTVEPLLTKAEVARIGAAQLPGKPGGRYRDRTYGPTRVKGKNATVAATSGPRSQGKIANDPRPEGKPHD